MKTFVLKYGVGVGLIFAFNFVLFGLLGGVNEDNFSISHVVGILIMLVVLSIIFLAIKRYRDIHQGGIINFKTAFLVGLGITVVSSVIYVIAWEVNLAVTDHAFTEQYIELSTNKLIADGATAEELATHNAAMDDFREMYANPFIRYLMTLTEILPIGLIVSLISAWLLRTKNRG